MSKKLIIEIVELHRLLTQMHFAHFLNNEKKNNIFFANKRNERKSS